VDENASTPRISDKQDSNAHLYDASQEQTGAVEDTTHQKTLEDGLDARGDESTSNTERGHDADADAPTVEDAHAHATDTPATVESVRLLTAKVAVARKENKKAKVKAKVKAIAKAAKQALEKGANVNAPPQGRVSGTTTPQQVARRHAKRALDNKSSYDMISKSGITKLALRAGIPRQNNTAKMLWRSMYLGILTPLIGTAQVYKQHRGRKVLEPRDVIAAARNSNMKVYI
jgi:histone H3/H4